MVADQTIGRRLTDGNLGGTGDPGRYFDGHFLGEDGLPVNVHDWPHDKPSIKAVYDRPTRYDGQGRITQTAEVLLPSSPNKDAKWLRRGWLRRRYVHPKATGIDVLPRFNAGQPQRVKPVLETMAEREARLYKQQLRAEIDRERWEEAHGKDTSDPDEPDEIEVPMDMEIEASVEQPEDSEEVQQLKRELEVARKTLTDMLAKGVDRAIEEEPIHQPTPALEIPDEVDPKLQAKRDQMAKARAARASKKAAEKEAVA